MDDCGDCYGGNAAQDCAGDCYGDSWVSDCGCVAGDNSGDDCDDCAGTPNGDEVLDDCGECDSNPLTDCIADHTVDIDAGANLISFYALPADLTVSNIFDGADAVIGQGVGAVNVNGGWIGSLTEVSQDDGYWVKVSSASTIIHGPAEPVNYDADGEVEYAIAYGNNLISYPSSRL
jgi:hypothetical protein